MRDDVAFIKAHTVLLAPALVPEIRLHLARASREIFQAAEGHATTGGRWPPYWAFAWPGGQGLARYILDHPSCVAGKRVADIGAGSGLAALAALRAGALSALAVDPDPLACAAMAQNAASNGLDLTIRNEDPLGTEPDADLVLIGDLVYEPELEIRVAAFLEAACRRGTEVLYGDRTTARRPPLDLMLLEEYRAPLSPALEDDHIEHALVWRLVLAATAGRPQGVGRRK